MQNNLFPPVHAPGHLHVSDECTWKHHHADCRDSWCECACHPDNNRQALYATVYLVGPKPAYLQYFHNIVSSGYSDAILHETEYTVELTFVDRQSFSDTLTGVKSITLEYEKEA